MNTRALTWMTVVGLAAASVPASQAGDREWATAGKILTGVAVGSVLTRAFCEPQPVVYAPPPTTVVYAQPAPVVVSQPVLAPAVTYAQPVAPAPVVVAPAPVQTITYVQAAPHCGLHPTGGRVRRPTAPGGDLPAPADDLRTLDQRAHRRRLSQSPSRSLVERLRGSTKNTLLG